MCWSDERLPACSFYSAQASWDYFTEFELSSNSSGLLVPETILLLLSSVDMLTLTTTHVFPAHLTWHRAVHCALCTTVHNTVCVLQRCSSWLRTCCMSVNTQRQTLSRRQTVLFYCVQWRCIVVWVDVFIESKQQKEKYIVMLTARMFNVNVTSCSLPLSLFRPEERTTFHSDTDSL